MLISSRSARASPLFCRFILKGVSWDGTKHVQGISAGAVSVLKCSVLELLVLVCQAAQMSLQCLSLCLQLLEAEQVGCCFVSPVAHSCEMLLMALSRMSPGDLWARLEAEAQLPAYLLCRSCLHKWCRSPEDAWQLRQAPEDLLFRPRQLLTHKWHLGGFMSPRKHFSLWGLRLVRFSKNLKWDLSQY